MKARNETSTMIFHELIDRLPCVLVGVISLPAYEILAAVVAFETESHDTVDGVLGSFLGGVG